MISIQVGTMEHYLVRVRERELEVSGSGMTHSEAVEKAYSEATGASMWEDTYLLERAGDWRIYAIVKLGGDLERVAVVHSKSEVMQ